MRFPSVRDIAAHLVAYKRQLDLSDCPPDERYVDVRLVVRPEDHPGCWDILVGDPSYDQDHRGFWGASSLSPSSNCRELARELIDQRQHHNTPSLLPGRTGFSHFRLIVRSFQLTVISSFYRNSDRLTNRAGLDGRWARLAEILAF